ncbi:MAG: UDP-N-acetylmuramoyl-L-alanine--D-glutamate ligase [Hyphomicrobiaceae bacterium]|nr:UDP-N-acetylmuramoyl-L-alanine--D-glutamate ligase [Hyphomicrobiaceae bacterium]
MIRASTFKAKRVAVFGLGGSGLASARALSEGGAEVVCWDDGEAGREAARREGFEVADLAAADWSGLSCLLLAPGVPLTHPEPHWVVRLATAAGVEIIGDIEVFCRQRAALCPTAPFVAITGTNGKSTTTALTAHLLSALGFDTQMGGNIGKAILTLEAPAADRVHVIEMSSFQIDLTPSLAPSVGALLNVTPDHLDRHGTIEHYAAIKERLVIAADIAAIAIDDAYTRRAAEALEGSGRLLPFTVGKGAGVVPRLYAIGSSLFAHEISGSHATSEEIAVLEGIPSLRGRHNVQNALAALACIRGLQHLADAGRLAVAPGRRIWDIERLRDALATFPGLPHRMEEVGRLGPVLFINDSKATNADSAQKALLAFPEAIYWIAGGKPKSGGIAPLAPLFSRIAKAYLIGEAAAEFAETLQGTVPFERSGTLADALSAATRDAAASGAREPVVLLSPACASFDQFKNFEVRGDAFRDLVSAMPGVAARERRP